MNKAKLSAIVLAVCLAGVIYIVKTAKEIEVSPEFNPNDGLAFIIIVGIFSAGACIFYFKHNK
jgi:hypothetical protein